MIGTPEGDKRKRKSIKDVKLLKAKDKEKLLKEENNCISHTRNNKTINDLFLTINKEYQKTL